MRYNEHKGKSQKSHFFYTPRRTTISKIDSFYIVRIQDPKNALRVPKPAFSKKKIK